MLAVTPAPGRARLLALMLAWRLYAVPCRCQGLTVHIIWDGVEEGRQVGQSRQKLREPAATPRPLAPRPCTDAQWACRFRERIVMITLRVLRLWIRSPPGERCAPIFLSPAASPSPIPRPMTPRWRTAKLRQESRRKNLYFVFNFSSV